MMRNRSDLKGKVVIITGASAGIGEAAAREFARSGARVALAARRAERLEALAGEIRAGGGEALAVPADLGRLADIQNLVQQTLARFGRVDVLFNNAGFGRLDWLEKLDPADIEALVAVNVLGVIQTARQVLPVMIRQRSGCIINMASVAGLIGTPTYSIYAASKFAVRGFSEALRREAAPWGIRVSVVCPGGVRTEFAAVARIRRKTRLSTPGPLVLTPERVARVVVGLARHPRPPPVLVFPWLFRLPVWLNYSFPRLADWIIQRRFTIAERGEELRRSREPTERE
jgi:NADP-dependent 3-hydroxy acid dehydrogenase YdfG